MSNNFNIQKITHQDFKFVNDLIDNESKIREMIDYLLDDYKTYKGNPHNINEYLESLSNLDIILVLYIYKNPTLRNLDDNLQKSYTILCGKNKFLEEVYSRQKELKNNKQN